MKKNYIQPESLTIQLGTRACLMQASLPVNENPDDSIDNPDDILTKEGRSVWADEW